MQLLVLERAAASSPGSGLWRLGHVLCGEAQA